MFEMFGKKAEVHTQLNGLVTVLTVSTVLVGVIGILQIGRLSGVIMRITEADVPMLQIVTRISVDRLEQAIVFERILALAKRGPNQQTQEELSQLEEEFDRLGGLTDDEFFAADDIIAEALTGARSGEVMAEFQLVDDQLRELELARDGYESSVRDVIDLIGQGDLDDAIVASVAVERQSVDLSALLQGLLTQTEAFTQQAEREARGRRLFAMVVLAVVVALGLAFAIWFGRVGADVGARKERCGWGEADEGRR